MGTRSINLGAGVDIQVVDRGRFFRLKSTTAPVTVYFYRGQIEFSRVEGVEAGYWEEFDQQFDQVRIYSATAQAVEFFTSAGGKVGYDRSIGSVVVLNQTTMVNAAKIVTNASGQLLAANAARKYLLIQNKDAAGIIYVTFDGTAATAANGVEIGPKGYHLLDVIVPTGAIMAIGSIASNANVLVVEG